MWRRDVSKKITYTGIFTALVAVTTMIFQIYIPSTKGYFNIGEAVVYISALLLGPYIGAFAGGMGSAIADIVTGYFIYAPATLVIKGLEGFIVGFLATRNVFKRKYYRLFTISLAIVISLAILFIGLKFYSGEASITFSLPLLFAENFTLFIPQGFWIILSILVAAVIIYIGISMSPEVGWIIFSIILGGAEMVLGYFIYEQFVLGYYAYAELPFNATQVLVGLIISLPIWRILKKTVSINV